jgi:hypothetical protein
VCLVKRGLSLPLLKGIDKDFKNTLLLYKKYLVLKFYTILLEYTTYNYLLLVIATSTSTS